LIKIAKIVEDSTILQEEIKNKIIKQEEEKMIYEIKKKFMTESILIDKAESIKFLITNIQEALGK
jgi:hypothetical protein